MPPVAVQVKFWFVDPEIEAVNVALDPVLIVVETGETLTEIVCDPPVTVTVALPVAPDGSADLAVTVYVPTVEGAT